jgi:hypothetical protein
VLHSSSTCDQVGTLLTAASSIHINAHFDVTRLLTVLNVQNSTVTVHKHDLTQVSYTVTKISDSHGYMEALGATQTALVMREAAEGRAKNEAESTKNTSLSQVSILLCVHSTTVASVIPSVRLS